MMDGWMRGGWMGPSRLPAAPPGRAGIKGGGGEAGAAAPRHEQPGRAP